MQIYESAENYLETILVLQNKTGYVRSIDIVHEMGFSKPSVSNAMKAFRENGYITMEADGQIKLTASGREVAQRVLERHEFLRGFLLSIGVSAENAHEDACRIEHIISQETFDKLREYAHREFE